MIILSFPEFKYGVMEVENGVQLGVLDEQSGLRFELPFTGDGLPELLSLLIEKGRKNLTDDQRLRLAEFLAEPDETS